MPIVKIKKDNQWIEVTNALSDADTLDGKHADAFALATELNELQNLVGEKSVADQVFTLEQKVSQVLNNYYTKNDIENKNFASETYVDEAIASIPTPNVSGQINAHNASENAHMDIREAIPTNLSQLQSDDSHQLVSAEDKQRWDAKSNFSGSYNDLTNKPEIPSIEGLATENYVNEAIAAIPTPDASGQIEAHNTSDLAHADIREAITLNTNAIELLTNGVNAEEVDSVNDLIQYVKDHGGEVTGIKADIKTHADNIEDIWEHLDNDVAEGIQNNTDAIDGINTEITNIKADIKTNETNIGDIFLALGEDEPKTEAKTVSGAINELYDEVNTKADKTAFIIIDQADNKAKTIDGEIITANEILATVLDGTNVIASYAGALLTLIIVSNDVCVFTGSLIEDNDHFTIQIDIDNEGTATFQVQDISDKVSYNEQTLTEEQKSQARANIGAGTPQLQADHAQNDPTASDYIKNRLGWIEDRIVLDETIHMNPTNEFGGACTGFSSSLFEIKENTTYIVTINDKTYSCKSKSGIGTIGNLFYIGDISQTNEEEPFIIYSHSDVGGTNILFFAPLSEAEDWNVTIKAYDGEAHKIDLRLLPEGVGYSDSESRIFIPKQSFTFENGLFQTPLPEGTAVCEPGKRYIVTWEDKSYSILCKELDGNIIGGNQSLAVASFENTQEPFFFVYNPDSNTMIVFTNMPDGVYEIELKTDPVHKIDPKYYEQPYYSEYFEHILLDDNSCDFPFELIGSKVTSYCPNRFELKLNPAKPETEGDIYISDSSAMFYGKEGLVDIPVLFVTGKSVPVQMGDFNIMSGEFNFCGLMYCYEKTKILLNNQECDKGWYYIRGNIDNEIFLVDSWNPKKDPVYLYLGEEPPLNLLNIITSSQILSYTITENNILYDFRLLESYITIGNFNSFFLSNFNYYKNIVSNSAFLYFILIADLIHDINSQRMYSFNEFKKQIGAAQDIVVAIEPIKKLKKIESQYIPYIQSDWNQNDETKPDYIKNRIGGWSNLERNEILKVPNADFEVNAEGYKTANLSIDLKIEKNKNYEVCYNIVDGFYSTAYLPCKRYNDTLYLGNYSLYDSSVSFPDETDYPFVIISNNSYPCWIYNKTLSFSGFDFTITLIDEIIHQIPEKYIPNANNIIDLNECYDENNDNFSGIIYRMLMSLLLNNSTSSEVTIKEKDNSFRNKIINNKNLHILIDIENKDNGIYLKMLSPATYMEVASDYCITTSFIAWLDSWTKVDIMFGFSEDYDEIIISLFITDNNPLLSPGEIQTLENLLKEE